MTDTTPMNIKKLKKILPTGVPEELEALDHEGLRKVIAEAETSIREQEDAMEADEALAGAKATVKDLAGAYRDAIKVQRAKQRYAAILMDGGGRVK